MTKEELIKFYRAEAEGFLKLAKTTEEDIWRYKDEKEAAYNDMERHADKCDLFIGILTDRLNYYKTAQDKIEAALKKVEGNEI